MELRVSVRLAPLSRTVTCECPPSYSGRDSGIELWGFQLHVIVAMLQTSRLCSETRSPSILSSGDMVSRPSVPKVRVRNLCSASHVATLMEPSTVSVIPSARKRAGT